ncbi:MAG: nucleoside hydrolase [Xanthomonadales bacterium]|nr:nucleoside hydrolase [Xanthomonadales bacterium]
MQRLLIDTDPGVDDALALLMAYTHPRAKVEALTITAGNVGIEHTLRNALNLIELVGADTPVFAGCEAPLVRPAEDAAFVHGRDGFGDVGLPAPARAAAGEHAALAMVRLAQAFPGELVFVMLGPLSNLALALKLDPGLPHRVRRLVVMGGAVTGHGNVSRVTSEFNFHFDPEAAAIVFDAWPQLELVDWEATLRHAIPFADISAWLASGYAHARFYDAISRKTRDWMQEQRKLANWHAADALAMAVALDADAVEQWETRAVRIELDGALTRGMSVVDWSRRTGWREQSRILMRYDSARFAELIRVALVSS